MKREIVWTSQFKKDYKLAAKRHLDTSLLDDIIRALSRGEKLPEKNKDHNLSGNWAGHRECHILPDWLLVYRIDDDVLVLTLVRNVSTPFKNVIFRRNGMSFFAGKHTGVYSLNHRFTCRPEARQVLIYQCILDLTGENDKYNYSKAAHLYPPFSYIPCSAKNYKIAPALTVYPLL